MIRVYLESPFAADTDAGVVLHRCYLAACIRDCLHRGESPFASHGLYTTALDDRDPVQRALGIDAGAAWRAACDRTIVYGNFGISSGMAAGIAASMRLGHVIVHRMLGGVSLKVAGGR